MKAVEHSAFLRIAAFVAFGSLLGGASTAAADDASFKGKTITVVVPTDAGGTTDFSARLMAQFLAKYLPGMPTVIVENRPGAHGLTGLSYFAQQAKPDGLTVAVGSTSQLDARNYRIPQSHYDPSAFAMIGGVNIGGGVLIIRNEALPRLTDKTARPVFMGTTANEPDTDQLMAAWGIEYLGWNVKWVPGYTAAITSVILALKQHEIDMTGFNGTGLDAELLDKSKYTIVCQTGENRGTVPSSLPSLAGTPLLAASMKGKIADPLAQKAFEDWLNASSIIDWMALPPGTPTAIVNTYRAAFRKVAANPEFLAQGKRIDQEFSPVLSENLTAIVDDFAQASPEVIGFIPKMLRRQGVTVAVQ